MSRPQHYIPRLLIVVLRRGFGVSSLEFEAEQLLIEIIRRGFGVVSSGFGEG